MEMFYCITISGKTFRITVQLLVRPIVCILRDMSEKYVTLEGTFCSFSYLVRTSY